MKFRSKKQQALYDLHGPERRQYLETFPRCAICGASSTGVHEMTNGPYRMKAFGLRAAWLATCSHCNCFVLTDKKAWPLVEQMATKFEVDPEYFDIDAINEILAPPGRVVHVVTASEILEVLRKRRFKQKTLEFKRKKRCSILQDLYS